MTNELEFDNHKKFNFFHALIILKMKMKSKMIFRSAINFSGILNITIQTKDKKLAKIFKKFSGDIN